MWPFIVLPIVLATGYRAVQTVWVIFMHYTLKTMYIQCTCIILGKFILARPSRVKRSKGFALHSQPLSKSHQPNPQMNVSGRIVGIMISFLSCAAGATSMTWMTTDWSWSGCWTWSWIVCVRFVIFRRGEDSRSPRSTHLHATSSVFFMRCDVLGNTMIQSPKLFKCGQ